jgi:UDP-N-acetylmuramate dehydrogenase
MITRHKAYDLSQRNTFGMKVSCRLYVEVMDPEDLLTLDFDALPQPVFIMGGGSNLLFTNDFPGTILHMGNRFLHPFGVRNDRNAGAFVIPSEAKESVFVTAGAGVVFDDFCTWAASEGLWGPENLSLIPGEVGASAVQNIGAYGVEAKDIIETVHAFDRTTRSFVDIPAAECGYGYRTSRFKTEWKGRYIITAVTYRLSTVPQPKLDYGGIRKALETRFPVKPGMTEGTKPEMKEIAVMPDLIGHLTPQMIRETVIAIREQKLPDPKETGSAGSFFCNPVISREHFERIVETARKENGQEYEVPHYEVGERIKVPAAWMIDQCGFKGAREGGAQVYPKQPLVIVNATGDATPEEIVSLERRIIDTIRNKYGIELHPEVEHVGGQPADNQ